MRYRNGWSGLTLRAVACGALLALLVTVSSRTIHAQTVALDDLSPAFLGMYRKVMEIEDEIRRHAERYGVDFDLARAVCLYESGGNPGLASHAGAQGYFQVMPRTFAELKVPTNIEAGVKYLAQMIQQFGREDRAVAAYNGGPGRVGKNGGLPLETLQYVVGVGHYRTVLKQYDDAIRSHASRLRLAPVRPGDDWTTLSERLGISDWELRLHNPFLAGRRLRAGDRIAYPPEPRVDLLTPIEGGAAYRMRHGDNYIKLAIILGVDIEALRTENALWQTQSVPAGVVLRIPFSIDRGNIIKTAMNKAGSPLAPASPVVVAAVSARPTETVAPADAVARASRSVAARPPAAIVHRVKRGDTLAGIARRYGTTITAIQQANGLRGTTIHAGQSLRIPAGQPRG